MAPFLEIPETTIKNSLQPPSSTQIKKRETHKKNHPAPTSHAKERMNDI